MDLEPIHLNFKKSIFEYFKVLIFCFFWLSEAFPAFALLHQYDLQGQGNSFWKSEVKAAKASESQKKQNTEKQKNRKNNISKFRYFAFSGSHRPFRPLLYLTKMIREDKAIYFG